MDFTSLRRKGISALERMTGEQWTDLNVHDPGITILEQLCYALTDLAYRTEYQIPDLLADGGADPYSSLHPPAEILTSRPVTPDDLRRLVLDIEGVKNAWIETFEGDEFALYHHPYKRELRFYPRLPPPPSPLQEIPLKGLYRVLIDAEDTLERAERLALAGRVARRLHENRSLCEDFEQIVALEPQLVRVEATVEIGPLDDIDRLGRAIVDVLAETISPHVPFTSLDEMLKSGRSLDEIFDGPRLARGFIENEALDRATRRVVIHASDLVRAIKNIEGVRAVSRIRMSKDGVTWQGWSLETGRDNVGKLDRINSKITLRREDGKKVVVRAANIQEEPAPTRAQYSGTVEPPPGRDRNVLKYTPVEKHFPALYGIGELGLPISAPPDRRAKAKQLKAYLMFFDQLMADYLAQLGHMRDLFAYDGEETRTYFTQAISDDPGLDLSAVRGPLKEHEEFLQKLAASHEAGDLPLERKHRFLNHLLARFSEVLDDLGVSQTEARGNAADSQRDDPAEALARAKRMLAQGKQAFLRDYPNLSGARGTAFNSLEPGGALSGFARRLRLKLGLTEGETFLIVEHILLRPMKGDDAQEVPLVSEPLRGDPYSLQLTFVFPAEGRFADAEFKKRVEQVLRAETPAHLSPYVRWMSAVDWETFKEAYDAWAQKLGANLIKKVNFSDAEHLPVRDARDRVIDLLGLGETYPLEDVEVTGRELTVDFETPATFEISPSQKGVFYELFDLNDNAFEHPLSQGAPEDKLGNGATLVLTGPAITEERTFQVRATKKFEAHDRSAVLSRTVFVQVGFDTSIGAYIDAPLLNEGLPTTDLAPRLVDYGSAVTVRLTDSQKKADYQLVYTGPDGLFVRTPMVPGTGEAIALSIPMIEEDTEIRILVSRIFDPAVGREDDFFKVEGGAERRLPLAVRARPDLDVSIVGGALADPSGVSVRITGSQASVVYSAYVRTLGDDDFVIDALPGADLIGIDVPATVELEIPAHKIWVKSPPRPLPFDEPGEYAQKGEMKPGSGGDLTLSLGPILEDSALVVRAHKDHFAPGSGSSDVQLMQAAVVLPRPHEAPALSLTVCSLNEDGASGSIVVTGGQAGVFYYFFKADEDLKIGPLPAYFHRPDKGVEQLRIETDFVVARDPMDTPEPLIAPIVDIEPVPADGNARVWAVWARTGVAWLAPRSVTIAAP